MVVWNEPSSAEVYVLQKHNWPIPIALLLWLSACWYAWWVIDPIGPDQRTEWLKVCAQAGAALFIAVGLVYTHRTVENARKATKAQWKSIMVQQKGQEATLEQQIKSQQDDRFFKAAELLSMEGSEDAHIAALFTLEQLAKESRSHYQQVIEVICAFIRRRSYDNRPDINNVDIENIPAAPHDIDVGVTILARRRSALGRGETAGLDLRGANFCGLQFRDGEFENADFSNAIMIRTKLSDCNFKDAVFSEAQLQMSSWLNCILIGSQFSNANATASMFAFDQSLPSPYNRVATQTTDGTVPYHTTVYGPPSGSRDTVVSGRYLDGSTWGSTILNQAKFGHFPWIYLEESNDQGMDLSGMAFLTEDQYARLNVPRNSKKPELLNLEVLSNSLGMREGGSADEEIKPKKRIRRLLDRLVPTNRIHRL